MLSFWDRINKDDSENGLVWSTFLLVSTQEHTGENYGPNQSDIKLGLILYQVNGVLCLQRIISLCKMCVGKILSCSTDEKDALGFVDLSVTG